MCIPFSMIYRKQMFFVHLDDISYGFPWVEKDSTVLWLSSILRPVIAIWGLRCMSDFLDETESVLRMLCRYPHMMVEPSASTHNMIIFCNKSCVLFREELIVNEAFDCFRHRELEAREVLYFILFYFFNPENCILIGLSFFFHLKILICCECDDPP